MDYKELLSRYKNGSLTEEEKQFVECEIERYQALEEYMSELLDEEIRDITEVSVNKDYKDYDEETAKLKKSVNRRLGKVVLASVALVAILLSGIFFGISPIVDSLYYNPDRTTVGEVENDISFDLYAISELNMPGFNSSKVYVDKKGFGEYEVMHVYKNTFNDNLYNVRHRIKRGEVISSYGDPMLNPVINANMFQSIRYPEAEHDTGAQKQVVLTHLKELNPVSYVSASIIFEDDLSMEELYSLELKYPDIKFEWAGIRTGEQDDQRKDLIGIGLLKSSNVSDLLGDKLVMNKYPAYFILDWLVSPASKENDAVSPIEAQAYEHHCISLLEYVVDRKDAVNVLEGGKRKDEFYQSALEYVKEKGVQTYGALVFAEAEDLLEMVAGENIKGVEFNQGLVSKKDI